MRSTSEHTTQQACCCQLPDWLAAAVCDEGFQDTYFAYTQLHTLHMQGFPSIVSSLTRQPVPQSLRKTVTANQRVVSPGANVLVLNGMLVEVGNFEFYGEQLLQLPCAPVGAVCCLYGTRCQRPSVHRHAGRGLQL